jgi:YVTN family beta-propeller protein
MGMHTGEPSLAGDRYVGLAVHRAARVCAAAHGGQVLMSSTTADLVADDLPAETELSDVGQHRLKDFDRPERLFQLDVEGLPTEFPPPRTSETPELPAAATRSPIGLLDVWGRLREKRRAWLVAGLGLLLVGVVLIALASRRSADAGAIAPAQSVAVIDIDTNRVVDSVPLGASGGAIAAFGGGIWTAIPGDRTLVRIDPTTREVTKRLGVGTTPYSLAVGANALWIGGGPGGTIIRLLRQTEETVQSPELDVPADGYPVLAAAGNGLWFGENDGTGIRRFDTSRDRVVAQGGGSLTPEAIAAGVGGVWVVERFDQAVAELIPQGLATRAEIPLGAPVPTSGSTTIHEPLSEALVDESGLWVTDSREGKVWRLRPAEGSIQATIQVGGGARPIASGGGSIWVANRADGTVSRIDPGTDDVIATIKVADRIDGITVAAGSVWVAVP